MQKLFKILEKYLRTINMSGEIFISRKEKTIYNMQYYEGEVCENSKNIYSIASLTKQFTAESIMKLVIQGYIKIEDSLIKYYPSIDNSKYFTVEDLLLMRTNLRDYLNDRVFLKEILENKNFNQKDIKKSIIEHAMLEDNQFYRKNSIKYCNTNYFILGDIIDKISGLTYEEYIYKEILGKLGLNNTFFYNDIKNFSKVATSKDLIIPSQLAYSACGLFSTTNDIARWFMWYIRSLIKQQIIYIKNGYQYFGGLNHNKEEKLFFHTGGTLTDEVALFFDYKNEILVLMFVVNRRLFSCYDVAKKILGLVNKGE